MDPEAVQVKPAEGKKNEDPKVAEATHAVIEPTVTSADERIHAVFQPDAVKTSLGEALHGHENLEAALPDLWRLLFFLRSGKQGSDSEILPKPMLSRQRVLNQPQKWQNVVQHQVSLLDGDSKAGQARQGRQQAWIKHVEQIRLDQWPSLPPNASIERGDVVAALVSKQWVPAFVLSIWRSFKSGSGNAQLCPRGFSRGSLAAARVVCALVHCYQHVSCHSEYF